MCVRVCFYIQSTISFCKVKAVALLLLCLYVFLLCLHCIPFASPAFRE